MTSSLQFVYVNFCPVDDEMEKGDGGMFSWFKKLTGDSKIEELKKQFAQMDKDGGGYVDRDEIV